MRVRVSTSCSQRKRSPGRNEGLETLAGVTGAGAVIRLAGDDKSPLSRIPRETAMHYVVTFEVEPAERTGQLSRVELRTARRARPSGRRTKSR